MKFEIIFLIISALFIIWAIPRKEDWLWDIGFIIFGLGGAIYLISFLLSLYNFIDNYLDQRKYYRFLKNTIITSTDYASFCKKFCEKDFRYRKLIAS